MRFRIAAAFLFAAGLLVALDPISVAQEKKAEPKPPRIAIDDPAKVKDDADFKAQGEYEGEFTHDGKAGKVGVQLVAQGESKFLAKLYMGGLPGAGWDGMKPKVGTGVLEGGKVTIKDESGSAVAVAADGVITPKSPTTGSLKRVERKSPTLGEKPPAGAVVLFAGEGDEKNWNGGKLIELSDGKFLNYGITSKQAFGAMKLHVEFRLPWMPNSRGQGRGNSGVYLQDRYECQVLDSFGLTGENNECGGFYQAFKPSVNMCLPPLVWQTYDIEFAPAEFDADGKKTKNARATVLHNGVKIHDNVEFKKESPGGKPETAKQGVIQFQNHGDPLVYRNIWVVEKK